MMTAPPGFFASTTATGAASVAGAASPLSLDALTAVGSVEVSASEVSAVAISFSFV